MERDKLDDIYRKYYNDVYLYAFALCKNKYLAEEITSDTFYKAFLSLEQTDASIRIWLFRVCKNCLIDYWRRSKWKDQSTLEDIKSLSSEELEPLEHILKEEQHKKLFKAMLTLPKLYQEIMVLFYYEGLSGAEIAKFIGQSPGAIRTILYRARKELKAILEEEK